MKFYKCDDCGDKVAIPYQNRYIDVRTDTGSVRFRLKLEGGWPDFRKVEHLCDACWEVYFSKIRMGSWE